MSFLSFHFIFSLLWYPPAFADLLKRNHGFAFALPNTMASMALASPVGPVSGYQAPGPATPSTPLSCCWGGDGLCARFLSHRSVALSIPTAFLASSSSLRQTKVSHTQTWEPKAELSVPGWLSWLEEVYIMELRMQWLVIKGWVGRTKWHKEKKKKEWETSERNHHPFLLAIRNCLRGTFCPTWKLCASASLLVPWKGRCIKALLSKLYLLFALNQRVLYSVRAPFSFHWHLGKYNPLFPNLLIRNLYSFVPHNPCILYIGSQ